MFWDQGKRPSRVLQRPVLLPPLAPAHAESATEILPADPEGRGAVGGRCSADWVGAKPCGMVAVQTPKSKRCWSRSEGILNAGPMSNGSEPASPFAVCTFVFWENRGKEERHSVPHYNTRTRLYCSMARYVSPPRLYSLFWGERIQLVDVLPKR